MGAAPRYHSLLTYLLLPRRSVREKKNECVHSRYLALNERSDTVQLRGALLQYALLCRAGSGRCMLNNGARLEKKKKICCDLCDRIKYKIWLVRYYFIVSLGTILVSQFRSSGPARRVSKRWEPTYLNNLIHVDPVQFRGYGAIGKGIHDLIAIATLALPPRAISRG